MTTASQRFRALRSARRTRRCLWIALLVLFALVLASHRVEDPARAIHSAAPPPTPPSPPALLRPPAIADDGADRRVFGPQASTTPRTRDRARR